MKYLNNLRMKFFGGFTLGLSLVFVALNAPAQTTNKFSFQNLNLAIPDGSGSGLSSTTNLTSTVGSLSAARVRLTMAGEFNGDLYAYLRHVTPGGTNIVVLLNRPGRSATNSHGYDGAGLDVTLDDSAVNDIHLYGNITNLPAGSPLVGRWQPDGRKISPTVVLDTSARNTSLNSFSSMTASGDWTLFVADVEPGGTNMLTGWELEIVGTGVSPVTWPTPADIFYGTALGATQLNASSSVPGTFAYNPPTGTVLSAGSNQTLSVIFTPTDLASYASVTNTVNINVQKKTLTIAANNTNKVYGQTIALAGTGFTSSGLANADTVTSVTLTSAGTAATATVAGGPYAIVPSAAVGSGLANYSISYANGTLAITPAGTVGIVSASRNPARPGESLTLSFAMSAVAPGSGNPSGTVQFRLDGGSLGSASLTAGVASFDTAAIGFGAHAVVAEYSGDGNFNGATNALGTNLVINTPPIAVADSVTRSLTNELKIRISNLLGNDVESDATDAIRLVSVGTSSVLSGTIVSNGLWLYYTPPVGNTNADSFTYSIADTLGGSSTGTVNITTRLDAAPSLTLRVTPLAGGNYLIQFDGFPNGTYDVEAATALNPANWQTWVTTNTDANGMITLIDTSSNGAPAKYYRTLYRY